MAKEKVTTEDTQELSTPQVQKLRNEYTGPAMAELAAKALRDPMSLTANQIRSLAACALTQVRDKQ